MEYLLANNADMLIPELRAHKSTVTALVNVLINHYELNFVLIVF